MLTYCSKLTKDEGKRDWIHGNHGISDIWKLADQAKETYEGKEESRLSEWISKFSCRIQYYRPIMDTVWEPDTRKEAEYKAPIYVSTGATIPPGICFLGMGCNKISLHC